MMRGGKGGVKAGGSGFGMGRGGAAGWDAAVAERAEAEYQQLEAEFRAAAGGVVGAA